MIWGWVSLVATAVFLFILIVYWRSRQVVHGKLVVIAFLTGLTLGWTSHYIWSLYTDIWVFLTWLRTLLPF